MLKKRLRKQWFLTLLFVGVLACTTAAFLLVQRIVLSGAIQKENTATAVALSQAASLELATVALSLAAISNPLADFIQNQDWTSVSEHLNHQAFVESGLVNLQVVDATGKPLVRTGQVQATQPLLYVPPRSTNTLTAHIQKTGSGASIRLLADIAIFDRQEKPAAYLQGELDLAKFAEALRTVTTASETKFAVGSAEGTVFVGSDTDQTPIGKRFVPLTGLVDSTSPNNEVTLTGMREPRAQASQTGLVEAPDDAFQALTLIELKSTKLMNHPNKWVVAVWAAPEIAYAVWNEEAAIALSGFCLIAGLLVVGMRKASAITAHHIQEREKHPAFCKNRLYT
ncbi:MAG: hypothetical protein HC848_06035 [Limnobacter sp.]|nr:hypothetical protein [Limnobacter sp.]